MRDEKLLLLKILILVMAFALSACQKSVVENNNNLLLTQTSPSVSPTLDSSPAPNQDSPIRKIDFKNSKYPWVYMNSVDRGFFKLSNGEQEKTEQEDSATLQKIEYGDVTNDGEAEAIISIYPDTGGNCSCDMVYIYTYNSEKPKLIWGFGTGDRAEGGLKKVYAENGNLIVELFGDDKFENGEWKYDIAEGKFNGLCCPTTFTKLRFKWNGKKFVVDGKSESFDYDWRKEMNRNNN